MGALILLLSMGLAVASILGLVFWFVGLTVHWQMTKESREVVKWDYANFKQFQAEVAKHKIVPMPGYRGSFQSEDRIAYIHAGIIRFGNRGMCLNPIAFLQFQEWRMKNTPKPPEDRQVGLWSAK